MFGSIMPEPLAVPPTVNDPRAVWTVTACSFGNGSVVMMARAVSLPLPRASAATAPRMPGDDAVHLEVDADDAGRCDEHFARIAASAAATSAAMRVGIRHPLVAGAGVGAAAVHDDRARDAAGPREMLLRDEHRRRLREVRREESGRRGGRVGRDHGQIERVGLGLDAAVQRGRRESLSAP